MQQRNFIFEIVDMDGQRIDKVLITPSDKKKKEIEESMKED
ncbi:MAG: hypothetical protein M3R72_11775 [Bacteroidota bacterium]|nr:hypothetical protein [Bacteroidota bacterium]